MSEEKKENSDVVNFTIDGVAVTAPKGTTVYTAAKKLGCDIPIFCYQDRMPPFGACRVCLVEVEKMGKPQTSCTLIATEGMVVHTQSEMSKKGREQILEFLLINHPLDCPVCDKGGECPLQDQTMKFGPGMSRFYEEKRHFKKPIPLSPVLLLDRERCIICARCTRFGDVVAGDHALEFIDRGYKTEVGVPGGGTAESKYIGNTISICPVGALTSRVYRFRARPWDNKSTETTCTLCPVGCSMIIDERDGEIMRTRSKENRDVNDIWLCDKGWFGYEFSEHQDRLQKPLIRKNGQLVESSWDEALTLVASKITEYAPSGQLAAFGGNPLTVEENYLFQKLMREAGSNHVDHRIGTPCFNLEEEGLAPGMQLSLRECEELSFILLLGIDLTEEFPLLWLRLKQAINKGAKIIFIGHYAPEIFTHLHETILHAPGEEVETFQKHSSRLEALSNLGKKGALFVGSQYLNQKNRQSILSELTKFPTASLNLLEGKGNSMGARIAGMRPDAGPFGDKINHRGLNALQVMEESANMGWKYLHVAGANPALKFPAELWKKARSKLDFLVVQDLFLTETALQADVVLPTLCFMEKHGHFVNIEGRLQKIHPGKVLPQFVHSDAHIFLELASKLNLEINLERSFADQLQSGSLLAFRQPLTSGSSPKENQEEGLRATFVRQLFDHGTRMRHNPHLLKMSAQSYVRMHPSAQRNIKDGDEVTISASGNLIQAKVKFDDKVAEKTVVIPLGFPELPAHNLASTLYNGLIVEVKKQ